MTLIASGNNSWSLCERSTTKWPPSSHSNVVLPSTTSSTMGWVASVDHVPISASNGASMGSRSVMSVGPFCRAEVIAQPAGVVQGLLHSMRTATAGSAGRQWQG